jgi:hypothetical protein
MASEQTIEMTSHDEIPEQSRSDSISATASDVTNETLDDACSLDEIHVEPTMIRVSSPGPNGRETTEIAGSSMGPNLDNVNLNISVKINKSNLKGKKVKDEPSLKEQTIDVAPHLGVKAVAKEESDSKKDKDRNYTIDLQFTINMDKLKKGKGQKERRRRHKSDSDANNGGGRGEEERGSDVNDLDLGEGAVGGGNLSDVIPEEPEGQSGAGTPRGWQGRGENGDLSPQGTAKKLGTDCISGYDSGYFDYGKKQTTDLDEQEGDDTQPSLRISGSLEDTGNHMAEEEDRESSQQQLDAFEKSKRKSQSDIRKERAKRLKDKFAQPPRLVLRRNSAAELNQGMSSHGQGQLQAKVGRRYSITAANELHRTGSSEEEALDDADTGRLDTLIMLNKLRNFLKKNMPRLKRNADKQTEQSSQPVVINSAANYAADLDNGILENLPINITSGHDLDTSFTTEDGEHSGEVTPRNASDTDDDEVVQEALTPRNVSPSVERRSRSTSPQEQSNEPSSSGDKLNKQTAERKTRLTRQSAKEDYLITEDQQPGTSSQINISPRADDSMRPIRLAERKRQMLRVPSIEVSNENDETVEVIKPKSEDAPKSPKIQRAKSESAVSQGLLAPYCKIDVGNGLDSDEVFTLSAHRSPHFRGKHGQHRTETLKMDSHGRTRAEIVLDCDNPDDLTPEGLGIQLAEGEELRVLTVLVLDVESTDADQGGHQPETQPEFPHSFAPIGIIPLSEEKADLTDQELNALTEKAEEILKDTERGQVFQPVLSPKFQVSKPKAPTTVITKVLRRAATETQAGRLQTMEEPAIPVTLRIKSPQVSRRALSECGSPRGSPRIVRRELYKEFFEPTRRVTRSENEVCSPIEKTHHHVIENLNQMQFDKQISGEDISTSGLGGYHKDFKFQRRGSHDSVGSDSSSGGSKEEQKQERVFVFPPRNNFRSDSDREDTASVSSGSSSIEIGDSIRDRRKSLEDKFKQDLVAHAKVIRLPKTPNFSNVREDFQRKLSDGESSRPVLDGNRTRKTSEPKICAFERPPEYAGVRNKFEKLIANDGMQSPTLSRRPQNGRGGLSITRGTQFSRTDDGKRDTLTKKPEQTSTWRQRELERSKSESKSMNTKNSNSRILKSCPDQKTDDEWFMPSFGQKTEENEHPRSRDVSPFRVDDSDWFFSEIKPEVAGQQQSSQTLMIPGSPDARQKRHQWSETVIQQNNETKGNSAVKEPGAKSRPGGNTKTETKIKVSLNSNNNARKSHEEDGQDWLFSQTPGAPTTQSSPAQHTRSKTAIEPQYGLTIQAKGKHEIARSSEVNDYGLTLQASARPRTVSQGSEADEVFLDYPGNSTPRSPSQAQPGMSQNPFIDYKPVGRHQPIVIDGRTPAKPQSAIASASNPRMSRTRTSRTLSEGQRSKPIPAQGKTLQQSPHPQMSKSTPSQSSMSGLAVRAVANSARNSPSNSRDSRDSRGDCQQGYLSMTSVDSGWFSDRLDSTMSDVFDLTEQEGYTSDTTETPRPGNGRSFFSHYNGQADDEGESHAQEIPTDSAITELLDQNDGYGSDDELFRQRCIDVFKTLHHEDVVYQQFQKLLRFRQRRISLHKDNFKIILKKDDRSESDSDGNVAYLV